MRHDSDIQLKLRAVMIVLPVLMMAVSCLKDTPESLPEKVEWDPQLAFPLGENSYDLFDVTGFDSSMIDLDTVTGFPQWLDEWVEREEPVDVVMEGNMDLDISAIMENLDEINGILFRVNFKNSFPDEIFAQGYFRADTGPDLDSMFSDGPVPVPAATILHTGEVVRTGKAQQDAYFDRDRIIALEEATHLYLKAFFIVSDPDSSLIPHYPEFWFNVQLGAMFDLSIEF